jgi:hypothetical protein
MIALTLFSGPGFASWCAPPPIRRLQRTKSCAEYKLEKYCAFLDSIGYGSAINGLKVRICS